MALFDRFRKRSEAPAPEAERPAQTANSILYEQEIGRNESPDYSNVVYGKVQGYTPVRGRIGTKEIQDALATLQKYKSGKASLEQRAISAQQWWRIRNFTQEPKGSRSLTGPHKNSAWLFNSISNKHADAMDNYPVPNVLPREQNDEQSAEMLSKILPVVFEQAEFEKVYSNMWWDKLICGTGIISPVWDNSKLNGMGDISIRNIDILNLFWEPGISDIQDSANVFHVEWVDNKQIENAYPKIKGQLGGQAFSLSEYVKDDSFDTSEKTLVVDWYYKRDGFLHFCKFANNTVLFASENEPEKYPHGWYEHGEYPFIFDSLFVIKGSPCGFGYVDVMKDVQTAIDELDNSILKNAVASSRVRYFIRDGGGVNEEEFADIKNDLIHVASSSLGEDSIRQIVTAPLSGIYTNYLQMKIDELKETSGNRDFSQGGTAAGVTSGSAIAALQEAGNKLSRDMISASYRVDVKLSCMVINLMREFYSEKRTFRITGMVNEYIEFNNSAIAYDPENGSAPIFDIKIIPQKKSPFSREIQNERAKEFFAAGFFNPQMAEQALSALEMMDFEGKEQVIKKVRKGQTYDKTIQELQMQVAQLGQLIKGQMSGTDAPMENNAGNVSPGEIVKEGMSQADKMRLNVQNATNPA